MKVTLEDIENSDFGDFVKRQKNKPEQGCSDLFKVGDPYGYLPFPLRGASAGRRRYAPCANRWVHRISRTGTAKRHTIEGVPFAGEPNVNYPNSILPVGDSFGFILKLE